MAFGRSKNEDEASVHTSDEEICTPVAGAKASTRRTMEHSFSAEDSVTFDELLSPRSIEVPIFELQKIYDLKALSEVNMRMAEHKILIKICKYYSKYCRFTGNPRQWDRILDSYRKGSLGNVGLINELDKVKKRYELLEKE